MGIEGFRNRACSNVGWRENPEGACSREHAGKGGEEDVGEEDDHDCSGGNDAADEGSDGGFEGFEGGEDAVGEECGGLPFWQGGEDVEFGNERVGVGESCGGLSLRLEEMVKSQIYVPFRRSASTVSLGMTTRSFDETLAWTVLAVPEVACGY